MIPASSFRRRPESSRLNNSREAEQPIDFVRYAESIANWIPACAGTTGVLK